MNTKQYQAKKNFINGKTIVGIDPDKGKHQAIVIDEIGNPVGSPFTFKHSFFGFHITLWKKLKARLQDINPENVVFAVEISINYWQKLCHYLHKKGFTVLMVSPLATKHERPKMSGSFTKTDQKDALAVANNARQGYFNFYKEVEPFVQAMHQLSITYDKINKDLTRIKQRLRSQVEQLFPEFTDVVNLDTDTARYLLSRFMTPEEFLELNLFTEAIEVRKKSRNQYDLKHMKELKQTAEKTIGIEVQDEAYIAERLTMNVWLSQIRALNDHLKAIREQMVGLAQQTDYFDILTSLKGVSDISAARFIAESRELSEFDHYKKIETFAGVNLKLSDSGRYSGYRHITHLGNRRLNSIIYKMSEETKNYIPEVRIKFLKRQMKQPRYRKNVIAVSSNLLKLIVALIKENRKYRYNPEKQKELEILEAKYKAFKEKKKRRKFKKAN
jgi:transposase